jgi:hypothetical protein
MGVVLLLGDVVVFHPYPPWSFPGDGVLDVGTSLAAL